MDNGNISRRDYMKMVSAAGLAGGAFVNGDQIIAATAGENKPVKRPDILVFMVDQLGAKWLEAASRMKLTPHYDRLKDRGTTFTRCITSNPVCTPARSTMITGMTTRQHGVLQNGYPLDPELPNYVRILKAHGYRTAGFGKFHFFPHHIKWDTELSEYGFDLWKQTQDPNKRTFVAKAGIAKRGSSDSGMKLQPRRRGFRAMRWTTCRNLRPGRPFILLSAMSSRTRRSARRRHVFRVLIRPSCPSPSNAPGPPIRSIRSALTRSLTAATRRSG